MIRFNEVTVTYPDADAPTLRGIDLTVEEGELCLVIGRTGAGKSTFLGAINGLVPHFTGGHLTGRVTVDGRDTRTHRPRDLADVVGVVGQDPLAGFVTDTVEEELAYAMEQLAVPAGVMRKRVEETLDLLGIAELRSRPMRTLSGGQQQRVAIGSVLTAHPRVLVLDEPTSALDPTAAEEVLAAITRLVHDLGVTVVVAEHRMERVVQYADRVIHLPGDGTAVSGPPAEVLAASDIAPPIVRLGRLAGWHPLPLSVRDARREAGPLRHRLLGHVRPEPTPAAAGAPLLEADRLVVRYEGVIAVREVSLELPTGQVVALMGRNGSGKSSLLWALQGSGPRQGGTVLVAGQDPAGLAPGAARALVGLVPQSPADLLYLDTVDGECAQADREADAPVGACRMLLERLVPDLPGDHHPRDLSEGERLGLVLAVQLSASPQVLLLDEPTRGLDYGAKDRLRTILRELADQGRAVVVATHDVEFVAAAADHVIVMAEGEVVASGPTAEVVSSSPAFAPQVAKVLAPQTWLTVDEVSTALAANIDASRSRGGAMSARPSVVRIGARSGLAVALASVAGLAMFLWPLLLHPRAGTAHVTDAPFLFMLILPAMLAVVLSELGQGTLDAKTLAMLGVLTAVGAGLRPLGAGTGGIELVFFLLVLAGRVYGPGFGFVLGATTLFASALLTGGVGPWLPFQMLASSWVGLGAGFLPRAGGRREIALLAVYGAVAAYVYGFLLNLSFWPFTFGTGGTFSFVPGASVAHNLHLFFLFSLATSTWGWDTARALTNVVAILVAGPAILATLRRAARRAAFDAPVAFDAPDEPAAVPAGS